MALKTSRFDRQDHLKRPEDRAAAFEDGDTGFIVLALNDISRAIGMTQVARAAGVTREGLYKSLGENGDPKLSTLLGVLDAIGLKLSAAPAS